MSLTLINDSGYINKKQGLPFLLHRKFSDTTQKSWRYIKDTDTIAKYYKKNKNTYFICFFDYNMIQYDFETNLLIEIKVSSKKQEVIKVERYFHGNYSCCWNNFDGFQKKGDYFMFNYCGTGSGYCSSQMVIMQDVLPQEKASYILNNNSFCNSEFGYYSTCYGRLLKISDSQVEIEYHYQNGKMGPNCFDGEVSEKNVYKITFTKHIDKWVPNDTTVYNKINIF